MGSCVGSTGQGPRELWQRAKAYRVGSERQVPLPDTSQMATEELLRRGIAEAQSASASTRRHERACHVFLARNFLLAALQRYSRGPCRSAEISAHLLAVLLKLGEDTQAVQGVLAESTAGFFGGYVPSDPAVSGAGVGSIQLSDTERTPSEHSSAGEEETVPSWGYDQLQENFLSPDSSDEDEDSDMQSPGESVSGPLPMPSPEALPTTPTMSHEASQGTVRTPTLSIHPPSPASLGVGVRSKTFGVQEPPGHEDGFVIAPASREQAAAASARPSPTRSPCSGFARPEVRSAVEDAAAAAALSFSTPWVAPSGAPGLAGSPLAAAAKHRPLQPQQASQGATPPSQRRLARPGREEAKEAPCDALASRPRRRQPSQGSSSGSQNTSDSETGAAARRRAAKGRSEVLKEEQSRHSVIDEEVPVGEEEDIYLGPVFSRQPSLGPASPVGAKQHSRMISRHNSRSDADLSGALGGLDTLSLAGSYAPSMAPSPHVAAAMMRNESWTPKFSPVAGGSFVMSECARDPDGLKSQEPKQQDKEKLSVRILNGVSGEEEVRFDAPLQGDTEQQFLLTLDRLCLRYAGQALGGLNWLNPETHALDRFQRRKCDVRMVEELWDSWMKAKDTEKGAVLLLCTVPVRPPSELSRSKVRLKDLVPDKVVCGFQPVFVQLDTSVLEAGRVYHVAFTCQKSFHTYMEEARVLPRNKGVEVAVPLMGVLSREGLYDVNLVIEGTWRSDNRKVLTVGSSESELDSSSTTKSQSSSSFVPIDRSEGRSDYAHHDEAEIG
mmetsp:Transcript_37584/g.89742  ORF Transcript_37584/g.89742 Transcript_37584/m.89742 type:complete len:781 (-) Transcript_37584:37-2379(-)